jgi:hypothetical protein
MLETRTILQAAKPAERKANSKLVSRSRCLPTPLVRKIFLATNICCAPLSLRALSWERSVFGEFLRGAKTLPKKICR